MRIALTHEVRTGSPGEESESESPETVSHLLDALRRLGHEVEPVEVSGNVSRLVARLEALNPDLCFHVPSESLGRVRGAFYPALFHRLGIPFTGSDAGVCALTFDHQVTRTLVEARGVPVPRGLLVNDLGSLDSCGLRFPLRIRPNVDGAALESSPAVAGDPETLKACVRELLAHGPAGVLVEEFIPGPDLVVLFLERASPAFLTHVPAPITPEQRDRVMELSGTVLRVLGIRDVGRVDFRLDDDGEPAFIQASAQPALEKGAALFAAAALAGLARTEDVLAAIIESASARFGISAAAARRQRRPARSRPKLRVGLTFNVRHASLKDGHDTDAEHDSPTTIQAIREAIEHHGHSVVELEATPELPALLPFAGVDLVFNIAEGFKGRNRESQVPALLEFLGIPYTGSDPTALSLAMDKALAKRLVREAGFHTAPFLLLATGRERLPAGFRFPAIVKPVAEGSSKGILDTSVVETEAQLRELAREVAGRYRQAVLVEEFLTGREFTVGLLGERRPRALPPLEIIYTNQAAKYPVYSFSNKFQDQAVRFEVPARVTPELDRELKRVAQGAFTVLGCRDVARVDLRLDGEGRVHFIECNPLPGLTPGFSDLCVIAQSVGMDHRTLIGEILAPALRRYREESRKRRPASVPA